MMIPELLEHIRFARFYTLLLLDQTPAEEWFLVPPGGVSFVGWQVGHLTMAAYRLALERVRGRRPGDGALLPEEILTRYGRGSVPDPQMAQAITAADLRVAYDRVHEAIQRELPTVAEADFDQPLDRPHMICRTRREAVRWCAQHELTHAGQIGLLRRQLGHPPVW